jgi:hypothetical protein
LAFGDWLLHTLAVLLADDKATGLHEQVISVLEKAIFALHDNLPDFSRTRVFISRLVRWARGRWRAKIPSKDLLTIYSLPEAQTAVSQCSDVETIAFSISMEGEGDPGAWPAVAVRSPLSALMFSGNVSCVVARVLPALGQFADLCESVADLLLESIVPDASAGSVVCKPSGVGYLRLQAGFALSVQAQSIPPYISSEMILKLLDVIHDLVASNCELDDLMQEAMTKALHTTLKRFASVEIGNAAFAVEATLALARISSLRVHLKVSSGTIGWILILTTDHCARMRCGPGV